MRLQDAGGQGGRGGAGTDAEVKLHLSEAGRLVGRGTFAVQFVASFLAFFEAKLNLVLELHFRGEEPQVGGPRPRGAEHHRCRPSHL